MQGASQRGQQQQSVVSRERARRLEKKGKYIPVTGRGGSQGREMSSISHFPDNRLTDGGEVVSLTRRPPFTPSKIPGTHF
jgi:hypothetical protein